MFNNGSLDITNPASFARLCEIEPMPMEYTERGRKLALAYISQFDRTMTESEASEAIRLLHFRGTIVPQSCNGLI